MTGEDATRGVIQALNQSGLPYMLVGSLSSNFWGIARSTKDADIVVDLGSHSLATALRPLAPEVRLDPQISFEMITGTSRNVVRVEGTEFQIELFRLGDDPHDQERFRRKQPARFLGVDTFIASVEDVIITKLRWGHHGQRRKDIDDVAGVIAIQANQIDWEYVDRWCETHGTRELLSQIRATIPPV